LASTGRERINVRNASSSRLFFRALDEDASASTRRAGPSSGVPAIRRFSLFSMAGLLPESGQAFLPG
jgi:hypothetical protein